MNDVGRVVRREVRSVARGLARIFSDEQRRQTFSRVRRHRIRVVEHDRIFRERVEIRRRRQVVTHEADVGPQRVDGGSKSNSDRASMRSSMLVNRVFRPPSARAAAADPHRSNLRRCRFRECRSRSVTCAHCDRCNRRRRKKAMRRRDRGRSLFVTQRARFFREARRDRSPARRTDRRSSRARCESSKIAATSAMTNAIPPPRSTPARGRANAIGATYAPVAIAIRSTTGLRSSS